MKKIRIEQVSDALDNAIKENKKSILFVNHFLENRPIDDWFEKHPEFQEFVATPTPLYNINKDGTMLKVEGTVVLSNDFLKKLNNEQTIWYIFAFGNKSVYGFDSIINAIKNKRFVNKLGSVETKEFPLEKMRMFIGLTTEPGDRYSVSEEYYSIFDEVYCF